MSGLRFRPRDQRALMIGLVLVAPVLLYRLVVTPYVGLLSGVRDQIESQRDVLTRELRILGEAPSYPELTRDAVAMLEDDVDALFSGPDQLSAAAALVNYVGTEARSRRVLVQRSETRPASLVAPGVLQLQVGMGGLSDLQGLLEFFAAMEQGSKFIRVEEITIQNAQRVVIGAALDEEVLTFTAVVSGYALVGTVDEQSASPLTIGDVQ